MYFFKSYSLVEHIRKYLSVTVTLISSKKVFRMYFQRISNVCRGFSAWFEAIQARHVWKIYRTLHRSAARSIFKNCLFDNKEINIQMCIFQRCYYKVRSSLFKTWNIFVICFNAFVSCSHRNYSYNVMMVVMIWWW